MNNERDERRPRPPSLTPGPVYQETSSPPGRGSVSEKRGPSSGHRCFVSTGEETSPSRSPGTPRLCPVSLVPLTKKHRVGTDPWTETRIPFFLDSQKKTLQEGGDLPVLFRDTPNVNSESSSP